MDTSPRDAMPSKHLSGKAAPQDSGAPPPPPLSPVHTNTTWTCSARSPDSKPAGPQAPPPPSVPVTTAPAVSVPASVPASPSNKILGRNTNGTVVMTSVPSNEAELQLYRVMQRASLLAYYDTLLEMGGDDVQQLCEAGEEEFLEIMALVGMASKPLHVRRLQKALQEWFNNPAQFQIPLGPPAPVAAYPVVKQGRPLGMAMTPLLAPAGPSPPPSHASPGPEHLSSPVTRSVASPPSPIQGSYGSSPADSNHHPSAPLLNHAGSGSSGGSGRGSPSGALAVSSGHAVPLSSPTPRPVSPSLQLAPVLLESQIQRLEEAARNLARSLPSYQPRPHNTKKKVCKDLELVINMSDDDPRRMDEIRKYAAIYGRFDCKRKPEKPLTLHEVSVNEAAAQICRFVPALLTRRDELFPLARQVVRDSGYLYSKGHTNLSYYRPRSCPNGDDILTAGHKRPRMDSHPSGSGSGSPEPDSSDGERQRRQERLEAVSEELRALSEELRALSEQGALHAVHEALTARQAALQAEQADLLRHPVTRCYHRPGRGRSASLTLDSERVDTDDDSQPFSNASSPSQEVGDSRDSRDSELGEHIVKSQRQDGLLDGASPGNGCHSYGNSYFTESKVQVIASRGADIIAVANPALSMSPAMSGSPPGPAMLKLEPQSPPPSPEKA